MWQIEDEVLFLQILLQSFPSNGHFCFKKKGTFTIVMFEFQLVNYSQLLFQCVDNLVSYQFYNLWF